MARAQARKSACRTESTKGQKWSTLHLVRPHRESELSVVLSVGEGRCILGRIRLPRYGYRVCLSTIYTCSLRLREGTHLKFETLTATG